MVDIVMDEPVYQTINYVEFSRLGSGPWSEVVDLIYGQNPVDPSGEFNKVVELMKAIKGEPWTEFLHLDQVLPMFEDLPPQAWQMAKGQMKAVMDVDPADYLSRVRCPVLAISSLTAL